MSGTTDQAIDNVLGELISELQEDDPKTKAIYDRLVGLRTQIRGGRGDDWMGLSDPVELLALAGYRAYQLLIRGMTPPNWDFVDEVQREDWRKWAYGVVTDMEMPDEG